MRRGERSDDMRRNVAIVGIGMTPMKTRWRNLDRNELANMAIREALDDAGLAMTDIDEVTLSDIDYFTGVNNSIMWLADDLGAYMKNGVKYETGGTVGGSSCHAAIHHVAAAASDVVLASATMKIPNPPADSNIPIGAMAQAALSSGFHPVWERFCTIGAAGFFAILASAYVHQSGCTEEAAAACRVKAARNAQLNEKAHLKMPLTTEDVVNSPLLVWPLRLLHMCPTTEGSTAVIFASEEKAREITDKPVWVRDIVTIHSSQFYTTSLLMTGKDPMDSPASLPSLVKACEVLYGRNNINDPVEDLDVIEMYDPSTWAELIWMEDMGLCERGGAWRMVERGETEIEGRIPVNPSGGVVSTNPGTPSTMIRYIEVALQIRGEAGAHQIPGDVRRGVATGFGGTGWTPMVLLSRDLD